MQRRPGAPRGPLGTLWYEASPYVYAVVGLASILFSSSTPGMVFSGLLVAVSLDIIRRRRSYRSHESEQYRKYARPH
jgi:hypothetical protein